MADEEVKIPNHILFGIVLLIPGIISVFIFLISLFGRIDLFENLSNDWTGFGDSISALPFYFGLTSICGAYLVKPDLIFVDMTKIQFKDGAAIQKWNGAFKLYNNGLELKDEEQMLLYHIIGYILLIPGLIGVLDFLVTLFYKIDIFENLNSVWTSFGSNTTSALPFYFALMAIAGAYLIKPQKYILKD